jgi:hypothetical protein
MAQTQYPPRGPSCRRDLTKRPCRCLAEPFDLAIEQISEVNKLLRNIRVGSPPRDQPANIDEHMHIFRNLIGA